MKIKINAAGRLEIERAGKWALQYCPYTGDEDDLSSRECGDWCPLFREPEIATYKPFDAARVSYIVFSICHASWETSRDESDTAGDEIIDERLPE